MTSKFAFLFRSRKFWAALIAWSWSSSASSSHRSPSPMTRYWLPLPSSFPTSSDGHRRFRIRQIRVLSSPAVSLPPGVPLLSPSPGGVGACTLFLGADPRFCRVTCPPFFRGCPRFCRGTSINPHIWGIVFPYIHVPPQVGVHPPRCLLMPSKPSSPKPAPADQQLPAVPTKSAPPDQQLPATPPKPNTLQDDNIRLRNENARLRVVISTAVRDLKFWSSTFYPHSVPSRFREIIDNLQKVLP